MAAALRTQACKIDLIKKRASLCRIKAELYEMLAALPTGNSTEIFTQPEWDSLCEIYDGVKHVLGEVDKVVDLVEAIKP